MAPGGTNLPLPVPSSLTWLRCRSCPHWGYFLLRLTSLCRETSLGKVRFKLLITKSLRNTFVLFRPAVLRGTGVTHFELSHCWQFLEFLAHITDIIQSGHWCEVCETIVFRGGLNSRSFPNCIWHQDFSGAI